MEHWRKYLVKNNYSKHTVRVYIGVINRLGEKYKDIRWIRKFILTSSSEPNTVNLYYNVILSFMKFKKDHRREQLMLLKLPASQQKYYVILSKKEIYQKTANWEICKRQAMIRYLFTTGIRASEINNISEVTADWIKINGKGNKTRFVIHDYKLYCAAFPLDVSLKCLRDWVKNILGNDFTPHSLRRSFATHLLKSGANPKMVMTQMGHSKIETTFRYLNLSLKDHKSIYNRHF